MSSTASSTLVKALNKNEAKTVADWVRSQQSSHTYRPDLIRENELTQQSTEFLRTLVQTLQNASSDDVVTAEWSEVRDFLAGVSHARAQQGFSPSETATFVFSLKEPLFKLLRDEIKDAGALADAMWSVTELIDKLGLHTTEVYQKTREAVIVRQQRELLELSTPVVQLWDDILALPLVGTLDSARAQVVMETLLQKIVETEAAIAIIDITGVPTVDTLVAQHLLKTIAATRLMGADCIISGIRPQIAQTIVHLGVDLGEVVTKATLADAFAVALKRTGARIAHGDASPAAKRD
ncbi:MAG TPA: STAS domain-containing protein [Burkholderiales bacterium]|nr:STAS domain-containing protein [Burkholderiales bacterium]